MKVCIALSFLVGTMFGFAGCDLAPHKQRTLKSRITTLVQQRASADQIIAEIGPPNNVYTREMALGYLAQTPERDREIRATWELFSRYSETMYYQGPPSLQNYIFLDTTRKAVGSHFTSQ